MSTVVLGTVFGSRLNLNGDQGNLLALKRYLTAAGFSVELRAVTDTDSAIRCHFLLLGHGSAAAMASIQDKLAEIDWHRVINKVPGLAIGSTFEWLSKHRHVPQAISSGARQSEFQVAELGPIRVLGYRNTDSGLPNVAINGNLICSMLHGPVLAKNPLLLDRAARAAVQAAGLSWPQPAPQALADWAQTLNEVAGRVWELEAEQPIQQLEV